MSSELVIPLDVMHGYSSDHKPEELDQLGLS